jgi:hypothetical protein
MAMSKYHKVSLDNETFIVRDVTCPPFDKKFRVAPKTLKCKILKKLKNREDLRLIRYINSRIHFFIDEKLMNIEDEPLVEYITNSKNLYKIKNNIHIDHIEKFDGNF